MYYKTDHCLLTKDLFENFKVSRVKATFAQMKKSCKIDKKLDFFCKVFNYCFYLVLLDIIENNSTFVFPMNNKNVFLYVSCISGETFRNAYSKGKFKEIDFINSNFKGYEIVIGYDNNYTYVEKPIYITNKLKNKFYEYINNGRQY